MSVKIATKFKEWIYFHIAKEKTDFMSLNRLRLNLSVTSTLPSRESYVLQSRKGSKRIQQAMGDTSLSFDTMEVILNPYGQAPLTAVAIFHTAEPCCVSYTVAGHSARSEYRQEIKEAATSHFVPIWGLYPDEDNLITMTLVDSGSNVISSRTIHIKTKPLPIELEEDSKDSSYPIFRDNEGAIRYYLTVPVYRSELIGISGERYLLAEDGIATPTPSGPQPTRLHELNLLGCFYRTYYIATGIHNGMCEKEPGGNLLVSSNSLPSQTSDIILEIDRQTGAVVKRQKHLSSETVFPSPISFTDIPCISNIKCFMPETLDEISYSIVGWLNAPTLYQGASIETTDAVNLIQLRRKYNLHLVVSGDTLLIRIGDCQIQEILFAKIDRIYQMDMTPFLSTEENSVPERYTLAVPFTEMYSGTYRIVLRFADGGQEVLSDTVTLSRTRQS